MRRLIWLPICGFLLIAGAAIAAAAAAPSVTPTPAGFSDAASPAPSAAASPITDNDDGQPGRGFQQGQGQPGFRGFHAADSDGLLSQVLADLVKSGTITQAQSDAITNALQKAVADQQTQAEQQRQQLQQEWTLIQGFLSDGVITQDEVNQLPADSPFRQAFNSIAQNGKVTTEQLQQLMPGFGRGHGMGGFGPRRGNGIGPWGPGGNKGHGEPQASPDTAGTTS